MTKLNIDCRICGWPEMAHYHKGAVDCINHYRQYTEELRGLLPQGKQVLCASIGRDSMARLWIEGEATVDGIEHLITYLRFMQQAWAEPPRRAAESKPDDILQSQTAE